MPIFFIGVYFAFLFFMVFLNRFPPFMLLLQPFLYLCVFNPKGRDLLANLVPV